MQKAQTAEADVANKKAQECSRLYFTNPDGDDHLEKLLHEQSLNDSMAQLMAADQSLKLCQSQMRKARSEMLDLSKAEQIAMGLSNRRSALC